MDERAGHTLTMNREFAVPGTLTVKYVHPVSIGWVLVVRRGSPVERDERYSTGPQSN